MTQRTRWWSTLGVSLLMLIASFIVEESWVSIPWSMVSGFGVVYCGVRLMVTGGGSQVDELLAKVPSKDQESLAEILERKKV